MQSGIQSMAMTARKTNKKSFIKKNQNSLIKGRSDSLSFATHRDSVQNDKIIDI